jgi:hypothetical protein
MDEQTQAGEAVKVRKAPATAMKEKIAEQEAEIARLRAIAESKPVETASPAPEPMPSRSRLNTEGRSRRARGSNDLSHMMKLGVGFNLDPNFEYRWINGGLDDQRLHDKTRADQQGADWQPLTSDGKEVSDSPGTVLRRAVGTNQAGQVEYSYLCRKPKALYEEDHGAIQSLNDKRMQAIFEGRGSAPGESAPEGLGYEQRTEMTGQGRKAIKL